MFPTFKTFTIKAVNKTTSIFGVSSLRYTFCSFIRKLAGSFGESGTETLTVAFIQGFFFFFGNHSQPAFLFFFV